MALQKCLADLDPYSVKLGGQEACANISFNSVPEATDAIYALGLTRIRERGTFVSFKEPRYTKAHSWFDDPSYSHTCTLIIEGRGRPPRLADLELIHVNGVKRVRKSEDPRY